MTLPFPNHMEAARAHFGVACGHFAFAAATGLDWAEVAGFFPQLADGKSWCSTRTMEEALGVYELAQGKRWRAMGSAWPAWGVVLVQGLGSWMKPGVPYGGRLARTHWVAYCAKENRIADANADDWLLRADWEHIVMKPLLKQWKATGWVIKRGYWIQTSLI